MNINHNAESDFEKLRKENIRKNEEEFRKLFPAMLLKAPKQSDGKKEQKNYLRKAVNLSKSMNLTPTRRSLRRSCKREREPSPDTFSDDENSCASDNSTGAQMVVQFGSWGKRFKAMQGKAKDQDDQPFIVEDEDYSENKILKSPRRRGNGGRAMLRPFDAVTEEDLILVADRTSDKQYDQVDGTSCHQCRQKTDDLKTVCRSGRCLGIRGQFCGPCLKNRYGECAKAAIMNECWECPPCRGICNCSFCMKKRGRCATGILIHHAKKQGYDDVSTFLGLREKVLD